MLTEDGWEQQPGGLWLKVSPYDKNDPDHKAAAREAVRSTIETVSNVHGASFSPRGVSDNMRLLDLAENDEDSELLLELHFAKWDICERKQISIGASLGWNNFAYTPEGQLVRGRYTEDVCIPKKQLRELIKARPINMKFPDEGLMTSLERISLGQMAKQGLAYRFGEVAPDNTTMMRQLDGNGASMGTGLSSAVLEYTRMPGTSLDYFPMEVNVRPIRWKGAISKRNFAVRWKDGSHDVRFIVTKGRATAAGEPRIDIRPWDNGNPPQSHILEAVVASTLRAIEEEAITKKWGVQNRGIIPSPIIPILGGKRDISKALFLAEGDQINIPAKYRANTFGEAAPPIHVHVIGQKHMIEAFKGSETRLFGDKPMVPGVNVLRNENKPRP